MKSVTAESEWGTGGLEASVVAMRGSVVHGQVHHVDVVVMGVDGRVVDVMVVVVVIIVVQGGQVL